MIKILQVRNIDSFVESRRQKTSEKDRKTVQAILNDVRKNGDSAVKKYERKFNRRKTSQLRVSEKEIKEAQSKISLEERHAIRQTRVLLNSRQYSWHLVLKQAIDNLDQIGYSGVIDSKISKLFVPIPSVGCYIPGGQARYPSSTIMSVQIGRASCRERV